MMADTAPVMVWMSGTDTLCNFFNKQWLAFTERTMEQESETAGRKAFAFKIFDIATRPTYIVSSFNARRPFSMEYRLRRADGANRRVLDHGAPRYMPEGEFAGYIGSCLDITER